MSTKKEVTKKQSTEVATQEMMDAWGTPEISQNDIMISKILPMQGMSKMVLERKAQIGEYRDSVTGELLGSIDEPLEFIPCHVERLWIIQKEVNGKFEYQGMEPITRENEGRKWEMFVNGVKHRFDWNYLVYLLRPKDVAEGRPTPYIVQFRRTSVKAGKKLMTQMFVRNRQMGKVPAGMVLNLEGKQTSNDKGTYITLDVSVNRESTKEEVAAAFDTFKMVQGGEAKVDHGDIVKEEKVMADVNDFINDNVEF